MNKLRQSGEDYIETILILSKRGEVRSIDIVNEMNLSKPSVSRAVGILKKGGFINVDKDGYITLTCEGRELAESVYERHTVLTEWLVGIGVDEKTAEEDACRLEHNFSEESFEKLKNHIKTCHKKTDI
ncbi:MAG: metal-dependent transcriptional regulator [Oscillospiraceae bacterium]|nr:metal-dependent transcriptional regulator [Oscillospiraceae bacterium]